MSPPAALLPTPRSGGTTSAEAKSQTDQAITYAHAVIANCGVVMSPSKVSRLVRQFEARVMRNGWTFFQFLANAAQLSAEQHHQALCDPELARLIAYLDPTGETAVNNVLRERGSAGRKELAEANRRHDEIDVA